ncbi:pimeloyl-ACP methyl ester carboxylesterase [Streptosporangium becharense]|uniref:Pimeloyl-ACP methyl ester carboxylesterase n=1 Tax=Streptosporangium becharense TaxID=1816182 RepID=A0A7W9II66_9ACTN|nr:alpha/beta hydrolase [Streptosporangium becharense]MBB2912602.1 pimeloyl-ACP methyl ester carboxylesterase [Streptosporangium becharense]MBB5820568.1 pimeloyl-ACP methyl ester carboxylesterase [Streptosporangium becharense]
MRSRTAAALAAVALLAAACTGNGAASPSNAASSSVPTAGADAAVAGATLAWADCGDGFECAKLQVPLDHDEPGGERIPISVIRLPASGKKIGSLLFNPGGPGSSGVEYARYARDVMSPALRERFDIVGFDPRGVGESAPVRCLSSKELDEFTGLDGSPDSPEEITALEEGARRLSAGCQARSGKLLPHVGTADAARDMDLLRAAVGDSKLTYLGFSYGTQLGAVYADLFPGKVRALVLDGAVDPTLTSVELNATQARGFEIALDAFLEDCLKAADCPFRGSVASAREEITRLLQRTDATPLGNTTGDGRTVTEAWTVLGLITPLYDQRSWPTLRQALADALKGDGTTLLGLADLLIDRKENGEYANQTEAGLAVNCVDSAYPADSAAFATAAAKAAKESPLFGEYIMWSSLPCAYWPVKAGPEEKIDAPGAPPIVVVGTQRDPATPYVWAEALASQLSSGVLVGFDGDGHTAYRGGTSCVDRLVDDYLINLTVPKDGTRCPKTG